MGVMQKCLHGYVYSVGIVQKQMTVTLEIGGKNTDRDGLTCYTQVIITRV
jgi:hypothetical protein